jgi:Protein of unknown function (DUF2971)
MTALHHTLQQAIEDYEKWSDEYMQSVQRRTAINAPLYHYTSNAGLTGILSRQKFWFTDYRHLNDPKELLHGMDLAHAIIAKGIAPMDRAGLFYAMLGDLFSPANFEKVFGFFIASFSRNRDDLAQWHFYADDGRGFAIGIAPHLFGIENKVGRKPTQNIFASPVFYQDAATKRRHSRAISKAVEGFLFAANYAHKHLRDKRVGIPFLRRLAQAVIASPLIWNCLTCKHSGWKHENEVRLIILGERKKLKKYLLTRTRTGKPIPYVEGCMPLLKKGSIVEIVVGPAAPMNAEQDVRKLLDSLGVTFAVPIRRSKIPYRSS